MAQVKFVMPFEFILNTSFSLSPFGLNTLGIKINVSLSFILKHFVIESIQPLLLILIMKSPF